MRLFRRSALMAGLLGSVLWQGIHAQEMERVIGRGSDLYGRYSHLTGPYGTDAVGNLYARITGLNKGLVRIHPDGFAQQIFAANFPLQLPEVSVLNPDPESREDHHDGLSSGVPLNGVADFDVDAAGTLYAVGMYSHNLVRVGIDGSVTELIGAAGEGAGHPLDTPEQVSLDRTSDVLMVAASGSGNVLRLAPDGNISQVLGAAGIDGVPFSEPGDLISDAQGNFYLASAHAIFRFTASGEGSVLLRQQDFPALLPGDSLGAFALAVDDFGNLYFSRSQDPNSVFRYSEALGLERVLDETGDGTGKLVCAGESTSPRDLPPCQSFGNPLRQVGEIHVDAAQNLFVLGYGSRNVFRLTPAGALSEVADFNQVSEPAHEQLRSSLMDDSGNLHFTQGWDGSEEAVFRYAALPVEREAAFSLDSPHDRVEFDESGQPVLPETYSLSLINSGVALPAVLQTVDTRAMPFSALPWDTASLSTQSEAIENALLDTETAVLQHEGHAYTRELGYRKTLPRGQRMLQTLRYLVDGVEAYQVSGVSVPATAAASLSGEALMRRVYLGDDVLLGGPHADTLFAYEGDDILMGGAGDDLLNGGNGGNVYYGGDGVDTVEFPHAYADYLLSRHPVTGVVSVKSRVGLGNPEVDTVQPDVERLHFQDRTVAIADIRYWGEAQANTAPLADDRNTAPVYRFFNVLSQAFFYTTNPQERSEVVRNAGPDNEKGTDWPYVYQGPKYQTAHSYSGAVPLYRFYNTETGHHFFTISEEERDYVKAQGDSGAWPFVFEGIAFDVYASDPNPGFQARERAVYRFYSHTLNRHAFTTSETERQGMEASPDWTYEGIGFYAEALD